MLHLLSWRPTLMRCRCMSGGILRRQRHKVTGIQGMRANPHSQVNYHTDAKIKSLIGVFSEVILVSTGDRS
jgi:hypothetical protein